MYKKLVNPYSMLSKSRETKTAVLQFNINNLEWTKYILEEANSLGKDIILGVSEATVKYFGGYNVVVSIVKSLISDLNIKIDVCLHLDHGSSYESCKLAIDSGFTSVMFDGSKHLLEENISITKQVVEYASKRNVFVEAEVGILGRNAELFNLSNVDDCVKFVNSTGVNSLAPSIGNVHGVYNGVPNLDFNILRLIHSKIDSFLVLHGGSGLSDFDLLKCVNFGITKININTELQIAWKKGVKDFIDKNPNVYDPRMIIGSGEKDIKKVVSSKLKLLSSI